jgi:phosphoglycolate phosphatase
MAYGLVVFDFDGTLADSFAGFLGAIDAAAAEHGFRPLDPRRHAEYRAMPPRALLRELGLPLWKVPAVSATMRRALGLQAGQVPLFEGATGLLRALRRHGIRTAIVSSNSQANVERVLSHKYAAMIDHFGCGATIFGKRRMLRAALAALDIAPAQVLCVGDEIRDAQAAASLGLDFGGVEWGFATPAALAPYCQRGPFSGFEQILETVLAPG